jgi:Smg protein
MKESVLDILIYLFENYFDADQDVAPDLGPSVERDTLKDELERAGFVTADVERALQWLEQLSANPARHTEGTAASHSIRIFDSGEQARLNTESRGYILYLQSIGILNATQRELVIDRLLALEAEELDIEQVKWVVLMVLFTQPGQEAAYFRMEDLVFDSRPDAVH